MSHEWVRDKICEAKQVIQDDYCATFSNHFQSIHHGSCKWLIQANKDQMSDRILENHLKLHPSLLYGIDGYGSEN